MIRQVLVVCAALGFGAQVASAATYQVSFSLSSTSVMDSQPRAGLADRMDIYVEADQTAGTLSEHSASLINLSVGLFEGGNNIQSFDFVKDGIYLPTGLEMASITNLDSIEYDFFFDVDGFLASPNDFSGSSGVLTLENSGLVADPFGGDLFLSFLMSGQSGSIYEVIYIPNGDVNLGALSNIVGAVGSFDLSSAAAVPIPAGMPLLATALGGVAIIRLKRRSV